MIENLAFEVCEPYEGEVLTAPLLETIRRELHTRVVEEYGRQVMNDHIEVADEYLTWLKMHEPLNNPFNSGVPPLEAQLMKSRKSKRKLREPIAATIAIIIGTGLCCKGYVILGPLFLITVGIFWWLIARKLNSL